MEELAPLAAYRWDASIPGVFTGAADERAEGIITHAAQKLDIRAQPGEVFAHVARHTSGGQADVAGIGITQMDGRKGRAR